MRKILAGIMILLFLAGCVKTKQESPEPVSEPSTDIEVGPGVNTESPELPSLDQSVEPPQVIIPGETDFGDII